MRQRWLLVILFATYLIHEAWTLLPDSNARFKLFPYSNEVVSVQYYFFSASQYMIWILTFWVILHLISERHKNIIKWFLAFQCLELVEYFITYNEPITRLSILGVRIGINVTNIKIVVMFVLLIPKLTSWRPGKLYS